MLSISEFLKSASLGIMKAEWPLHNCFLQRKHLSIMAATLIPLPEIERLSSQVIRILGGNPGKVS